MTIDFYVNFDKRINSTKRPVVAGIVNKHTLTGFLKEPCSVKNPVINIQNNPLQNNISSLTYAYIPQFSRYYFVRDWTWNDGLWTVALDEDVLATWKPHIGETSAYVERSASDYNSWVMDKLYPTTSEPVVVDTFVSADWLNVIPTSGCYVVGVICGATTGQTGAVTYYALTYTELSNMVDYLLSDEYIDALGFPTTMQQGQQLTHDTAKSLLNPMQFISSCMWFPFPATAIGEANSRPIKVGYSTILVPSTTTIATGRLISDTVYGKEVYVELPLHPLTATRGKYLNYSPYTTHQCFLPPFGSFPLNPNYFHVNDDYRWRFRTTIDLATGKATLRVSVVGVGDVHEYKTNELVSMMGVPIQLAQVTNDIMQTATSVISAASSGATMLGSVAMANPIGAVRSGASMFQSIANAISSQMPQTQTNGATGSFSSLRMSAFITTKFEMPVDEDNTENGRPLCEVRRIDTLSGYIKCGEATVDFYAFDSELEEIHSFMLSGFFWE